MDRITQRERIAIDICDMFGVWPEYPWSKYPGYAVFRHPASRKWFGLVMDVPKSRLGFSGDGIVDVLDLRCGGIMAGSLLGRDGFLPAYHMNKSSWVSVLLDGIVPDAEVCSLLELSYDGVAQKARCSRR